MTNARYFRSQADLCLEVARHLSDAKSVERLRSTAAGHLERAAELEITDPVAPISDVRSRF